MTQLILLLPLWLVSVQLGHSDDGWAPAVSSQIKKSHTSLDPIVVHRIRNLCGVNALYVLLKIHGVPVEFADVEEQAPIGDKGISMLQLRDAARSFGLETQIRKCTLDELKSIRLPAVAHFRMPYAGGYQGGHYVILVRVGHEDVEFLDGTTVQRVRYPVERFPVYWTGYLLEVQCRAVGFPFANYAAGANLALWSLIGLVMWRRWRSRRSHVSVFLQRVFILLVVLSVSALCLANDASKLPPRQRSAQQMNWRLPEKDAVNCLFIQLRLHGIKMRYEEIDQMLTGAGQAVSLAAVQQAAKDCGLSTRIVVCSPPNVSQLPMPVITHLLDPYNPKPGTGGFWLVYGMRAGDCQAIDGGSARLHQIPLDDFRRRWSGYGLIVESPRPVGRPLIIVGVSVVSGYCWYRFRHSRPEMIPKPPPECKGRGYA